MDDLIADFVAECREMLEALGGEIVAWEAQPDDRARLDSIFRFVHTVKGNCGFFEFPRLEALSHAAEDALADVRAGRRVPDGALVSAVLAIIDRIGEMIAAIEAGEEMPAGDDSALISALAPGAEGAAAPLTATIAEGHGRASAAPRTIRLSVELLDRVMSTVSDMVLARNELARRLRESASDVPVDGAFERLSSIIAEMRDAITRTRMQRIENLFVGLPRMVRDLSADLGKQVLVDIEGGDVELDREMIEMIRDPLTHIIRNAVDHGIELPAERLKAGKREIGILSVSARQSGNQILIDIHDDGRGIDGKRLVEKAVANGVIEKSDAPQLTQREQLALIFEAGLSTAKEVTAISGRGVGMDVVRSNVERIGGVVEVDSKLGEGTRMTLRVPLTLTIIPALSVSIGAPAFRHSPLGDRGDRPRQWRFSHARATRRRWRRNDPRAPRARGFAFGNPRPRERGRNEAPHFDRAPPGRRRRLCALRRPHPRSRRAGGKARCSRGHGDRSLCRDHAGGRWQPNPLVRPRRPGAGRRSQARSTGACGTDRRRSGSGRVQGYSRAAVPRPRRRAQGDPPRGRRPHRGSADQRDQEVCRSAARSGWRCHIAARRG